MNCKHEFVQAFWRGEKTPHSISDLTIIRKVCRHCMKTLTEIEIENQIKNDQIKTRK